MTFFFSLKAARMCSSEICDWVWCFFKSNLLGIPGDLSVHIYFVFKSYFFLFVLFFLHESLLFVRYSVFQLGLLSLLRFSFTDWPLCFLPSFPLLSNYFLSFGLVLLYSKEICAIFQTSIEFTLCAVIFLTSNYLFCCCSLLVFFFFNKHSILVL